MTTLEIKSRKESTGRQNWEAWPRYAAAAHGFPNYWYPVLWSRDVKAGSPPQVITLVGETMMVFREPSTGRVHAMADRCPHRGVPLSQGTQEFPGTFSCPYHGWTFDLDSGDLVAAITDGPNSPMCGKVAARVFPVEERIGLIWIFVGDAEEVPPVEADIPEELLANPSITVGGRITVRNANWRYGTENGFDEGHAKWLHRSSWLSMARLQISSAWSRIHIEHSPDGVWATRVVDESEYEGDFPGLGRWPARRRWFQRRRLQAPPHPNADPAIKAMNSPGSASVRLPCTLRILMSPTWVHYEWCIGVDDLHYRYVQLAVRFQGGRAGRRFKAFYATFLSWVFHAQFTGQDERMLRQTTAPPERLYRPDASIIAWRRLCERARPSGARALDAPERFEERPEDDVPPNDSNTEMEAMP